MRSTTKVWLIVAVVLIISGAVLFAAVMVKNSFDFTALDTTEYVTNTYDITDDFNNISVTADTADIDFKLSADNVCRIVCFEKKAATHTVKAQNGTLFITHNKTQNVKDSITFVNINSPKITVYLPGKDYSELVITSFTSDVNLPKALSFESINIENTTGDIECESTAKDFINIELTSGDVSIEEITTNKE